MEKKLQEQLRLFLKREMKYKLIVSDFDDTIVDDTQKVSEETIRAIQDFESRGGKFVLCTGRMISAILPHARKIGLKGDVIGYQGAVVADIESGKFKVEHAIPMDKALKVAKFLEERDLYFQLYEDDTFVIREENEFSLLYRGFTFLPPKILGKSLSEYIVSKSLAPTKILIINKPERIPSILEMMEREFGEELLVNSSKRFMVEIVPRGIDKGSALKALANSLNIPLNEVIAVGDGLNDIPMLTSGAFPIAVANAHSKLKEYAKDIAPKCTEEPIKWIIEKYCK